MKRLVPFPNGCETCGLLLKKNVCSFGANVGVCGLVLWLSVHVAETQLLLADQDQGLSIAVPAQSMNLKTPWVRGNTIYDSFSVSERLLK